MIHLLQFPYNGEPPRVSLSSKPCTESVIAFMLITRLLQDRLVASNVTSNKDFFVRNHGGIPYVPEDDYTFEVNGLVNEPKTLTLADLKNENLFPRESRMVTLQCSGTRRIEQIHEYPGDGDELINAPVSMTKAYRP